MTSFTLSQNTQDLITLALSNGGTPGTHNVNYINAYQAIYNDIVANGNINAATSAWFQQAYLVNQQQWTPSAQGTYIWASMTAAAASEGATLTTTDIQNASNTIALTVFGQLHDASFVFNDGNVTDGFGSQDITADDAGAGLQVLKDAYPDANLDNAIWAGALFARTELNDPTYFSDQGIDLTPGSRDANAIISGWVAGSLAVLAAGGTTLSTGLSNIGNLDSNALHQALGPGGTKAIITVSALGGVLALSESAGILAMLAADYATNGHLASIGSTLLTNNATEMGLAASRLLGGMSGFFGGLTNLNNSSWGTTFFNPKLSPIILDLDGNGVTTIPESSGTFFDLANSGFAQQTGWVGPSDGLLVWDRNSNGTIDNGGELFGNHTLNASSVVAVNGFAALASFDSNSDGKIDSSDSLWSNLRIWIDSNSNGITDSGELHSLSSLAIQSLSVSYTDAGANAIDASGNRPELVGTYKTTGNVTHAMDDVFFASNTAETVPTSWVATTSGIDALPDLPGSGTMYSLHEAMARDTSGNIETAVSDFTTNSSISARNTDVEGILIDWAGAQGVSPTSRNANGGNFNAQHLAVLEAAMGTPFNQAGYTNPGDPNPTSATILTSDYFFLFERMYAELAAQTFLKSYYDEIATTTSGGVTTFDFSSALSGLFSTASDDNIKEFYRTVFASGIPDAQVNYAGLLSALSTNKPGLVSAVNTIVAPYYAYDLAEAAGTPTSSSYYLYATDGATIVGGLGGNTIYANEDSNSVVNASNTIVYGNAGTNTINASGGTAFGVNQIYGGTGADTVNESGTLVAGNIIDGGAGANTLNLAASTDISGASVTNFQTLGFTGSVHLNSEQLAEFTNVTATGSSTLYAVDAGTYSLSGKTLTGSMNMNASSTSANVTLIGSNQNSQTLTGGSGTDTLQSGSGNSDVLVAGSGTTTLIAGNGTGDLLEAGSGTDTLTAGSGGDTLYDGAGVDTMTGGTGNDTFNISNATSGSSISGGAGTDTLNDSHGDISNISITGVETLNLSAGSATLTASQLSGFTTITSSGTLHASGTGTYDLSGKTTTGSLNLKSDTTSAAVTLIGNSQNSQTLQGGSGTTTLTAGNGTGDLLIAGSGATTMTAGTGGDTLYSGAGVDTMTGGSGNDTFQISNNVSGTSISGGAGTDTLVDNVGSIINISITGVETLSFAAGSATLTASQLSGFSTLSGNGTINASGAGTFDISGKTTSSTYNLSASSDSSIVTLIGNNQNSQTLTGGSGADTLHAGNGNSDTLQGGSGNTTMIAGTGNDTLTSGSTAVNTYEFGSSFGADTINNNNSGSKSSANGVLAFLSSSTTDENLWFKQSGNNLEIDLIGTSDKITISSWYSNNGSKLSSFTANGLTLDTQVASLVSAMATYASNNPTFNPATAGAMPSDTTLQSAITAAWHA